MPEETFVLDAGLAVGVEWMYISFARRVCGCGTLCVCVCVGIWAYPRISFFRVSLPLSLLFAHAVRSLMFEYCLIDLSAMRVCHAVWDLGMAPGVGGQGQQGGVRRV